MKPLGQEPHNFPGKRNERFPDGSRNWWEGSVEPNKTKEKNRAKKKINEELDSLGVQNDS